MTRASREFVLACTQGSVHQSWLPERLARFVRKLSVAVSISFALTATSSFADRVDPDPTPPPVVAGIGQSGYDLITGSFSYSATEVVIGQPNAGGMSFSRSFQGAGWRDNYAGTINSSGSTYTVSIGSNSETFTLSGSTFSSDQALGSTLAYNSGSGIYTYMLRDGTFALFDAALANGGAVYDANVARITTLTKPNGEQAVWHYKSVTAQSVAALRLQSVTNNLGYQIHFDYSLNNPTLSSQLPAWMTLAKATGINNGVDYCDPTADTCPTYTVTWPSATYGTSGGYSTVTDNLSRVTQYSSGDYGLVAIRRPSTDSIEVSYDGSGRVYQVTNMVGTWTYTYSDVGTQRTITITDPLSHTRVTVADLSLFEITSDTNGTGNTTSYQYDSYRRVTRVTQPEGNYTQSTYDGRGNVSQVTNVAKSGSGLSNIVTSASFDSTCSNPVTCNQPNSTTDALGFRTDYTYDPTHGGVLTVTQPAASGSAPVGSGARPQARRAYTSLYAWYKNSSSSIVQAASPVIRQTQASACSAYTAGTLWNSALWNTFNWTETNWCTNQPTQTLNTIAYQSGSSSAASNLLPVSTTIAAGDGSLSATTTTAYDAVGNVQSVDGPLSGTSDTTAYYYDSARQLTGTVGPDSGSSVYRAVQNTYNADGQATVVQRGTVTSQSSNPWGSFSQLWRQENTYDSRGDLIQQNIVGGGSPVAVTQYSYDNGGRLVCTAQRMNSARFGSLPSACTLTIVANGLGPDRVSSNTYDASNRITIVTRGYGSGTPVAEATTTYTANGKVATLADGSGNLTTFVYDGFDRTSRMRYPNTSGGGSSTTDHQDLTYDANSNVTVLRQRDGSTLTNTYDNLNRVTQTAPSTSDPEIQFSYDLLGRKLTQSIASGQMLTFTYDALGRNLTQQSSVLGTVSYQYDLAGRRTRMTWPDSTFYVTYDIDLYNEITAIRENGAGSGPGVLATYTYDGLGRRTLLTRGNGTTETPIYDTTTYNLSSLAQTASNSSYNEALNYTSNPLGQSRSRAGSNSAYQWGPIAPGTASYSPNGLNQYTSVGGTSYSYDSRGNLTGDGSRTFGFDIYNHLTSVSGAGSMTLAYDPAGRLYQTAASSTTTRFLYDGDNPIAEYDTSGTLLRRTVQGAMGEPLVWYEGSGTSDRRYLIQNELGTVIAADAGSGVTAYTYDEYGNPNAWNGPASAPRSRYAGATMLPEGQLYHMGARDYAPGTGRFLQTDPILFDGGMNLYAYTANDPVNAIDPGGTDETVTVGPPPPLPPDQQPGHGMLGSVAAILGSLPFVETVTVTGVRSSDTANESVAATETVVMYYTLASDPNKGNGKCNASLVAIGNGFETYADLATKFGGWVEMGGTVIAVGGFVGKNKDAFELGVAMMELGGLTTLSGSTAQTIGGAFQGYGGAGWSNFRNGGALTTTAGLFAFAPVGGTANTVAGRQLRDMLKTAGIMGGAEYDALTWFVQGLAPTQKSCH